jgi:O-antigen ligase
MTMVGANHEAVARNCARRSKPVKGPVPMFCFGCALALVFLRFSFLHETLAALTGVNSYLLYVFGPLALLGIVSSGGIGRTLRQTPALFWLGFVVWMVLAIPFSSWRGGSFTHVVTYVRTDAVMLLIISGLARTWADCTKIMYTIAAATIFNLGTAHLFVDTGSADRLSLQWSGIISNPNDLAAHLLLVLPFLLFVVLKPATPLLLRVFLIAALVVGVFQILRTGSRGALVALLLTMIFILVRGSAHQRFAVGVAAPIALTILISLLPASTWKRLQSVSQSPEATGEAFESSQAREYLLKESILYTFQNPVFGIGPGQFSSFEGRNRVSEGLRGYWHETHNSYTQISSECGIPALLFYIAAAISTFGLLGKIRMKAAALHQREILTATFCTTIALVAYSLAALFVNFAYRFYFPAMSGLVIAMWFAVCQERPRPVDQSFSGAATTPLSSAVDVLHPYSP